MSIWKWPCLQVTLVLTPDLYPADAPPAGAEEDEHDVVEDLEEGDQAAAHAQAQDPAHVGHEPDDGNLLVALDQRHRRVLDVDVGQQEVLPGVPAIGERSVTS